ncbi:uncharacterized protein LOC136029966 isoform X2 [Artemia franciscana]|uniref:uncharacterized protein LOC136029966 isoform X2 n=1 Tax=Artemia franciscana TaxID=6661 RepID=UPI0032DB7008
MHPGFGPARYPGYYGGLQRRPLFPPGPPSFLGGSPSILGGPPSLLEGPSFLPRPPVRFQYIQPLMSSDVRLPRQSRPPLMPGGYRCPPSDEFTTEVMPTSSLINNPTGRLARRLTELRPEEIISLGEEYKDWRLDDTFLHRNGLLYPIFSKTDKEQHIACNICNTFVTGFVVLQSHRKGQKHAKNLLGGPNVDTNLKARLDMDYEFPTTKKPAEEIVETVPEPEVQEIALDPTDLYEMNQHVFVGLEYVIDVKDKDFVNCVLCEKSGNFKSMVCHIKGIGHRIKFLERHYPDVVRKFQKKDFNYWTPQVYQVLELVVIVIEKKLGRKQPIVITKNTYDREKLALTKKIKEEENVVEDQTIFNGLPDPFEEGVNIQELERQFGNLVPSENLGQCLDPSPAPVVTGFYQGPATVATIDVALKPVEEPAIKEKEKQRPDLSRVTKDKKNNGEEQIRKTRKELTNVPRKLEALKTGSESLVETGKRKKEMKEKLARLCEELKDPTVQLAYHNEKANLTKTKEKEARKENGEPEKMEVVGTDDNVQLTDKEAEDVTGSQAKTSTSTNKGKESLKQKHSINIKLKLDKEKLNEQREVIEEREERSAHRKCSPSSSIPKRRRSFSPKSSPRNSSVRLVSKRDLWKRMDREFKILRDELKRKSRFLEKHPQNHDLYKTEWEKFLEKRSKELDEAGEDIDEYNFGPEWEVYWRERMKAMDEEELIIKKDELIEKYQLEGYDPEEEKKQKSRRSSKSLTKEKEMEERAMRNPSPPTFSKGECRWKASEQSRSLQREERSRSPRNRSPKRHSRPENILSRRKSLGSKDITVLKVIRHLSTLENALLPLVPEINSIFGRAVEREKDAFGGSNKLLEDSSVWDLLDMIKERLIVKLDSGSVEKSMRKMAKKGIDLIVSLSSKYSPSKMSPKPNPDTSMIFTLPKKQVDRRSDVSADTSASIGRESRIEETLLNETAESLPMLRTIVEPEPLEILEVKTEPEVPTVSNTDIESAPFSNTLCPSVSNIIANNIPTAESADNLTATLTDMTFRTSPLLEVKTEPVVPTTSNTDIESVPFSNTPFPSVSNIIANNIPTAESADNLTATLTDMTFRTSPLLEVKTEPVVPTTSNTDIESVPFSNTLFPSVSNIIANNIPTAESADNLTATLTDITFRTSPLLVVKTETVVPTTSNTDIESVPFSNALCPSVSNIIANNIPTAESADNLTATLTDMTFRTSPLLEVKTEPVVPTTSNTDIESVPFSNTLFPSVSNIIANNIPTAESADNLTATLTDITFRTSPSLEVKTETVVPTTSNTDIESATFSNALCPSVSNIIANNIPTAESADNFTATLTDITFRTSPLLEVKTEPVVPKTSNTDTESLPFSNTPFPSVSNIIANNIPTAESADNFTATLTDITFRTSPLLEVKTEPVVPTTSNTDIESVPFSNTLFPSVSNIIANNIPTVKSVDNLTMTLTDTTFRTSPLLEVKTEPAGPSPSNVGAKQVSFSYPLFAYVQNTDTNHVSALESLSIDTYSNLIVETEPFLRVKTDLVAPGLSFSFSDTLLPSIQNSDSDTVLKSAGETDLVADSAQVNDTPANARVSAPSCYTDDEKFMDLTMADSFLF